VVSLNHESLVDLFRKEGKLAVELLRACARIEIDHARAAVTSIDLSQVAPIEYRADAVVVLHDSEGRPVTGVIVEVQLEKKDRKLMTWPAYVAILRAELNCAAFLLVIAPDPAVATWANRPIDLGHPGFQLTPIVIGFDSVPWIRDRDAALALPQLAVLSAMAHPELETADAAIAALSQLPGDRDRLYLDIILNALTAANRRILEARMHGYEYKSDFARKYYGEGLEKGLRTAVVALAQTKIDDLSDDVLTALNMVSDPGRLTQLITALGKTSTSGAARAALERVCSGQALASAPARPRRPRTKRPSTR
jgi:hypothetical protein